MQGAQLGVKLMRQINRGSGVWIEKLRGTRWDELGSKQNGDHSGRP